MLHKHLANIKCPICSFDDKWKFDGSSNEYHITDGNIHCDNNHKWVIKQELLRLDSENSDEAVIYYERDLTGYPKEVDETERKEFLDFIENYFQKLSFTKETVVVNGDPILFFRFVNESNYQYITVNKEEKLLRQIHETIVRKRLYNSHSFVRADSINVSSANQFYIFKNINDISLNSGDILIQLSPIQNEIQGIVLWTGQKYYLEEITK